MASPSTSPQRKVLFILHLPPPVHGAALVGKFIADSKYINSGVKSKYVNLATSRSMQDLGKLSFLKFFFALKVVTGVCTAAIRFKPHLCYLTFASKGFAFYKDMIIIVALRLLGHRLVLHLHHQGVQEAIRRAPWKKKAFRFAFGHSNTYVMLLSKHLYYDVAEFVSREQVVYCPNGIPDKAVTRSEQANDALFRLLFLSNMLASKGIFELLKALQLLKQEGLPVGCDFVGDWKDTTPTAFQEQIEALGLTGLVEAHGKKYNDDKNRFWAGADAFVLPSLDDAFPLVVLEAMHNRLPVIATHEGGIPDMVADGQTGFLVPKRDTKALADKIRSLTENRTLARQMGLNGRNRYETEFQISAFEHRFSALIQQLAV